MSSIQEVKNKPKMKKAKTKENISMKKSKIETLKTIALTALISGIIAFGLGVWYESGRMRQMKAEAAAIAQEVKSQPQQELKQ